MIKLETLKQLLETSLNNNNFEKFLRQLDEQPINKENFFDYNKFAGEGNIGHIMLQIKKDINNNK